MHPSGRKKRKKKRKKRGKRDTEMRTSVTRSAFISPECIYLFTLINNNNEIMSIIGSPHNREAHRHQDKGSPPKESFPLPPDSNCPLKRCHTCRSTYVHLYTCFCVCVRLCSLLRIPPWNVYLYTVVLYMYKFCTSVTFPRKESKKH